MPYLKLVFTSGGSPQQYRPLARQFAKMLEHMASPIVAFVPADPAFAAVDFQNFKKNFKTVLNKPNCICIAIDSRWSKKREAELLQADAIFLGGGNTFHFLQSLRRAKLMQKLKVYAKRGGILMGESAGSILMAPEIGTALVPSLDSDDNDIGLRNFRALGLVLFDFSPHYRQSKKSDQELIQYSQKIQRPVIACADGDGLIIQDGKLNLVGQAVFFHKGKKSLLRDTLTLSKNKFF